MVGDASDESATAPANPAPDLGGGVGDAAPDLGYTVTVDNFSGPLDLLLYLVRRTELDILEVPLAFIVDQFVDTVRSWQDADLDVAGEFILMAATLLELKARTIAPPLEQPVEGAEDEPMFDPRESLLKSLLAYRRFKEASQVITALGEARWPQVERQFREHVPEAPPEDTDIDLGEIDLSLLATTCERILSRIGGLGPRTVVVDEMPLGVRIATLLDELSARERATIRELLVGNTSRVVEITTVMATLELARQRFVEVQQSEQFGDIALRLRSAEERERVPELPPEEPEATKRRRGKLPLVTWHAPAGAAEQSTQESTDDAPEEVVESDEQRFLRELEEATRVTAVLALTADVEKSFTEHWYTLHPELKPAPAPVVPPEAAPVPVVRRAPPKRRAPGEATPAAEAPVPAASDAAAAQPVVVGDAVSAAPVADVPAAPVAELPAVAGDTIVAAPVAETPAVVVEPPAATADASAAPAVGPAAANAASATSPTETATATNDHVPPSPVDEAPVSAASTEVVAPADAAAVAQRVAETSSPVLAPEPVPVVAVDAPTPITEPQPAGSAGPAPQPVLPVEQWPVLHAQPAAEETPHPLDTIASDDPAAVNAALGEPSPRPARVVDDEQDDEDEDPDDLLADDPALVNAALQADAPRPVADRRPVSDVVIPPPTETTVWTAPVDRGQTVSDIEDEGAAGSGAQEAGSGDQAAGSGALIAVGQQPAASDQQPAISDEQPAASDEQPATSSRQPATSDEQPAASDQQPAAGDQRPALGEPTPSTEPLRLVDDGVPVAADDELEPDDQEPGDDTAVADPALIEAAGHAAAPRSVELHPIHDLTIPVATETTVWTAPVDRGQTAAEVDDDDESAVTVAVVPPAVVAFTSPLSDPTPTTAPLVLPASTSSPVASPDAAVDGDRVAVVADPEPTAAAPAAREPDPPPGDGPPVEPPPPPPLPLPSTPRSDSPNPAPTTSPTKPAPMSPPPRSKPWLLIALVIAINNAVWGGVWWFTWLPRDVLEVAATERGGTPEQETLTWRFNLDVVDALAQARPPELVPLISPAIPGRWHWSDARTLVFEAAGRLPLATSFTATLPHADFRTVHGFRLRQSATQTWSTTALSVGDAAVETFTRDGTTVTLTFNQPVDPQAIAQELSAEVAPVAEPAFVAAAALDVPVAGDQQPVVAETTPVAGGVTPDADSQQPDAGDQQPTAGSQGPVADGQQPAVSDQQPAAGERPAVVQIRAITNEVSSTIRLLIATPARGTARLRLPAGTRGVEGPLGLAEGWEGQIALRQTLVLDSAITEVPSHGDIRIDVAVSDPQAPRELLAPVVTVEPAVPVTVSTTDAGLSLTGAFVPGETYRIRTASTWPDEPATSGHVLSAYTAASEVVVAIPPRPAGIWPVDGEVVDGHTRLAAHAVERADVLLLTAEDECVASREAVWSGSQPTATLDLDDLTEAQPIGTYRLRVRAQGEAPTTSDQALHIDAVRVRPQALVAALSDWLLASLAGEEHADIRVRVVRLADR